ncbi:MAG TPA: hypothetical protein VHX99_03965 [Rhizomicrobium sp.]|jgi:hypothetical protein|nr:hypothetical protein [Rhizomicrobium sp.]
MSLVGPVSSSSSNAVRAAMKRARAAQKLKAASGLRASLPEEAETDAQISQEETEQTLAHSGTVIDVPIRNAQSDFNFTPTFITQLLGQLLPNPERKGSGALSAYKELYARIRVFDRFL